MAAHNILRHFWRTGKDRVVRRNLPLDLARAHVRSPEAYSVSAASDDALTRTRRYGAWFDFCDTCDQAGSK